MHFKEYKVHCSSFFYEYNSFSLQTPLLIDVLVRAFYRGVAACLHLADSWEFPFVLGVCNGKSF